MQTALPVDVDADNSCVVLCQLDAVAASTPLESAAEPAPTKATLAEDAPAVAAADVPAATPAVTELVETTKA